MTDWPACGRELIAELQRAPGRLGLVVGDSEGTILAALAGLAHSAVFRAGIGLLEQDPPVTADEVVERLTSAGAMIADLDLLFWGPWLSLDPLALLRGVSRRHPGTVFAWPGSVTHGMATYSRPGRRDWLETALSDAVVLRPYPTMFPDEPPYRIERYA